MITRNCNQSEKHNLTKQGNIDVGELPIFRIGAGDGELVGISDGKIIGIDVGGFDGENVCPGANGERDGLYVGEPVVGDIESIDYTQQFTSTVFTNT